MQSAEINGLIERVKQGEDDAFEKLSSLYAPLVVSVASSFEKTAAGEGLGSHFADLSQELSMALYRAAVSYDTKQDKVSFGLYAKRCLTNCAVSYLRKCRSAARRESAARRVLEKSGGVSSVFPDVPGEVASGLLSEVSDILSPFEKQVIELVADGVSVGEIALELGVGAKSVSNAVYRCKTKIKKYYEQKGK